MFLLLISLTSCKKSNLKTRDNEVVSTHLTATLEYQTEALLGEGAFWNSDTQEFYWIDIEGKKLHVYNPDTKQNKTFDTPSRIGTVVPINKQNALVALEDGVYKINLVTGETTMFSDVEHDNMANRFNDGKCDPNGNLWVGSMHLKQSQPNGNLYKIDQEGKAHKMVENVTISNGIVWTQDTKTMYYIDTPTGEIRAYDFDSKTSTVSNERVAVKVPVELGFPDGMAIDENDQLWVGLWNGNSVAHFDPISGQLISKIEVPAHNVTACSFGGENFDTMYITTARVDMTDEELEKYPLAGSVFKVKPGVKGVRNITFGENL